MSENPYPELDSEPIEIEKLAINSSEIDGRTGRIILPPAGMLNELRGQYSEAKPPKDHPTESNPSPQQKPNSVAKVLPTSLPKEMPVVDEMEHTEQARFRIFTVFIGCIIAAMLGWIAYEMRLTRLASERQYREPIMLGAPHVPVAPSLTDTTPALSNEEISKMLTMVEVVAKQFNETLARLDENLVILNAEVGNLEFEIIEPTDEEPAVEVEVVEEVGR